MTSVDPSLLTYDADKMETAGLWTSDQAQRVRQAQQQVLSLASPTPEQPLAYQLGQKLRSAFAPPTPEMRAETANATPLDAAVSAAGAVGHQARELIRGAAGQPSLASQDLRAPDAPAGVSAQPTPQQPVTDAMLRQPQVAYRSSAPAGGGGTGMGGAIGELRTLGREQAATGKEEQRRTTENTGLEMTAISDAAKVHAENVRAQGEVFREGQRQAELDTAANAERHQRQRAALEDETRKTDAAAQEAEKLSEDPHSWFGSLSTGGKIQAGIAIALGAMGQALAGGRNNALDIINKAIDDDIAAQRTNIARADRSVDRRYQRLRDMRDALNDDVQLTNVLRAQHWDNVQKQMQAIDLSSAPSEIQAQAKTQMVEAKARGDAAWAAVAERTLANATQNAVARGNLVAQGANLALQREQLDVAKMTAYAKANQGQIPGLVGRPISEQAVNEAAKVKAAMDGMRNSIGLLRDLYAEKGKESFGPGAERYDALVKDLQTKYAVLKDMGAVSGSEQEKLDAVIKTPNTLFGDRAESRLKTVEDIIRNDGNSRLKSLGYMEQQDAATQQVLAIPGARRPEA